MGAGFSPIAFSIASRALVLSPAYENSHVSLCVCAGCAGQAVPRTLPVLSDGACNCVRVIRAGERSLGLVREVAPSMRAEESSAGTAWGLPREQAPPESVWMRRRRSNNSQPSRHTAGASGRNLTTDDG